MSLTMQFVQHIEGGAADSLCIAQTSRPTLIQGQALVKVSYFGVNRADTLQRQGKYPAPKNESPVLGLEISGEIVDLHPQQPPEQNFNIGDQVFGLVAGGGYAEYVAVDSRHLLQKPKNMDMPQAAGIAECFLTAYQALFYEHRIQKGQKILIHAGASGVGLAAIQLAKRHGCEVAVTASSDKKLAVCESLGAGLLINYQQQDFAQQVTKLWSGCDFVLDFVGGDYLNRNLRCVNTDGVIFYLAMLAGRYADTLDMAMLLGKRASIKASTLRNRDNGYKADLIQAFKQDCMPAFCNGQLVANIDTVFASKDIGFAHQRIENNQTLGKLIGYW